MLAIAIGLVLVAALYVAMDVQFRYMQTGRDAVVEGQVARGLLSRMAGEIRVSLATLPKQTNSTATQSTTTTEDSEDTAAATGTGRFSYGLQGDEYTLSLFVSTLPRFGREDYDMQTGVSDLAKITYWLEPDQGLARQEIRNVGGSSILPDQGRSDILANEVVDLHFRYFDPSLGDWTTLWDGSTNGPPLAVEILLTIQPQTYSIFGRKDPTTYRMVVHVPTAQIPQSSSSSTTTGGTSQ
jgi:type II secretion system (T2SS) protein J